MCSKLTPKISKKTAKGRKTAERKAKKNTSLINQLQEDYKKGMAKIKTCYFTPDWTERISDKTKLEVIEKMYAQTLSPKDLFSLAAMTTHNFDLYKENNRIETISEPTPVFFIKDLNTVLLSQEKERLYKEMEQASQLPAVETLKPSSKTMPVTQRETRHKPQSRTTPKENIPRSKLPQSEEPEEPKIEQESCYEEHQWLSPLPESYNLKKQVLEEHKKIKVKEKSRGSANTQSLKADKTQLKTGSTEKTQVKFMPSINGKPWKTYLKLCDTETTPRQKKISINAIKFMIQPARGYV